MNEQKLFCVEFGEPNEQNFMGFPSGNNEKPIFVIARNYNEASIKASNYLKNNKTENSESIFTADGSLKNDVKKSKQIVAIQIVAIKLISDNIIS